MILSNNNIFSRQLINIVFEKNEKQTPSISIDNSTERIIIENVSVIEQTSPKIETDVVLNIQLSYKL